MAHQDGVPRLTYAQSGVDISAAERAKELIKPLAKATRRPGVLSDIGFFGGFFQLQGYREPVLVSSTDSVGTKVLLAIQMGKLDTIGIDLVNHCVNDIFVGGAEPLFFLDYIGLGKIDPAQVEQIVTGLAAACKAANCALIGGETAVLPGLYKPSDFDLVGFIVGGVERDRIIDGSKIQRGDVLLGVPSSGLHTNGYTLARRVFKTDADPKALSRRMPELGRTLGEALLEPHRPYFPLLKSVLPYMHGMAHITGGGLPGNMPRVLPQGLTARFQRQSWEWPPLFQMLQKQGNIEDDEMFKVFNVGVGLVIAVAPQDAARVRAAAPDAFVIGEVTSQEDDARGVIA